MGNRPRTRPSIPCSKDGACVDLKAQGASDRPATMASSESTSDRRIDRPARALGMNPIQQAAVSRARNTGVDLGQKEQETFMG
mmetsp:Transcript_33762/g.82323  ORF Transcript_33762/g.82323 Transcript_33762/m.82323 type:complete len:83 (-) Transcript_33762:181-429(-)